MAALGIRARIAIFMSNPANITVTVANVGPATPVVQVVLNGAIISETAGVGSVTLPFVQGWNMLQLCVADGGIMLNGKILSLLSPAVSMYPQGSEPFGFAQVGASTAGSGTAGGGASISPTTPPEH